MRSKIFKLLLLLILLTGTNSTIFAQANYWSIFGDASTGCTSGNDINRMTATATPTASSFGGNNDLNYVIDLPTVATDHYKTSAYDPSGNILFSVNGDGIFAPDGNQIMSFKPSSTPQFLVGSWGVSPGYPLSEINIFPKPGSRNSYYVMFWTGDGAYAGLAEIRVVTVTLTATFPDHSTGFSITDNAMLDQVSGPVRINGGHNNPYHLIIATDEINSDCSRDVYSLDPQNIDVSPPNSYMRKWHIASDGTLPAVPLTYYNIRDTTRFQTNAYGAKAKILKVAGRKYFSYVSGATGADISAGPTTGYYLNMYTLDSATSIFYSPWLGSGFFPQMGDPYREQIYGFEYVPSKNAIFFNYRRDSSGVTIGSGLGYFTNTGGIIYSANNTSSYENTDLEMNKADDLFMVKGTDPTIAGILSYLPHTSTLSPTITPVACVSSCSTNVSVKSNINMGAGYGYFNDCFYLTSQIRGENYSTWPGGAGGYTVSGTESWTTSVNPTGGFATTLYMDDIIIPAGASLTITGLKVEMAPHSHIYVGNALAPSVGGRLTLVDDTLTRREGGCDAIGSMWGGIVVQGRQGQSQGGSTGQGILTMTNSAICYATTGVANGMGGSSAGGLIVALHSAFINNDTGATFHRYSNTASSVTYNDRSEFHVCSFDINDNNITSGDPFYGIYGVSVKGLDIAGCSFSDNITGAHQYSYGIFGVGMGMNVHDDASGSFISPIITTCHFSKLTTAVYHTPGISPDNTVIVRDATFTDNRTGVNLEGTTFPQILQDTFYVPAITGTVHFPTNGVQAVGVLLNGATYYSVYSNVFHGGGPNLPYYNMPNTIGTLAINTQYGAEDNIINNNSYDNLGQANLANGINNETPPGTSVNHGLWYKCNNHTRNGFDIVTRGQDPLRDGIKNPQGVISSLAYPHGLPAGNTFTTSFTNYNLYIDHSISFYYNYAAPGSPSFGQPLEYPGSPGSTANDGPFVIIRAPIDTPDQCALPGGGMVIAGPSGPLADGHFHVLIDPAGEAIAENAHLAVLNNINYYLLDSLGVSHRDSVYYYVKQLHSVPGDIFMAQMLVADSLIDSANHVYDSIQYKYGLSGDSGWMAEYQQGRNLMDVMITSRVQYPGLEFALDSIQVDSLTHVAANGHLWAHVAAEGWLNAYNGALFTDSLLVPEVEYPTPGNKGVLAVTEISNGPSAGCEYLELVVANCGDGTDGTVDVSGWVVDDNSGNFNTAGCDATNVSTSRGHYRLAQAPVWQNVPVGSAIVLYNHDVNCYALADSFRIDTAGSGQITYWVPIGGTPSAPYGTPFVQQYFSLPDTLSCGYCSDSACVRLASSWCSRIGLYDSADAIQVRCPGCDSLNPGEPAFYHGIGYGPASGYNAFAPIVKTKVDLGGAVVTGCGGGRKYEFTGSTAADFGDGSKWLRNAADAAGAPPATLGTFSEDLIKVIQEHELILPCCGSGLEERHASSTKSSGSKATVTSAGISVYPNPANMLLYFTFPAQGKTTIRVMDVSGRLMSEQVVDGKSSAVFDLKGYAPGVYLYQVVTGSTAKSGKVVVER